MSINGAYDMAVRVVAFHDVADVVEHVDHALSIDGEADWIVELAGPGSERSP